MAKNTDLWRTILELDRLVFTTREIAALTGSSMSAASQSLARLDGAGVVKRVLQGVWAIAADARFSPFSLVPFLTAGQPCYVSFVSALHLHGMISQIPQTITIASTAHTRRIVTPVAAFSLHRIEPGFFAGFDWSDNGRFLIATPEKALADSLYIASRRGRRYAAFPEISFPRCFSVAKARRWLARIRNPRLRASVADKLEYLLLQRGKK